MLYVEKRKNKQAGFTLVELIVAIAIMGILLIIALPQVRKIQSANKDRKYEAYQSSMERGSKLYIDSYSKDLFGNNDSGCITIKYSELKNKNLVKDFSSKDITCSKDEETFVQVRKVKDEYKYDSSIVCRNGQKIVYQESVDPTFPCDNKPDKEGPLIEAIPKENTWVKTDNLKIKIKVADASGLNSNTGISYYFKTSAGTKVGKNYTYAYKNKKGVTSVQYQIPTSHLPKDSNQYYLVIEPYVSKTTSGVQDVLGNDVTSPSTFGLYKIDNVAPTCGKVTGDSTTWTNKDKTVSVACSDDASGCTQSSFSKPFTTTIKTSNIAIKDKAGNSRNCPVDVYLDKTAPSAPTAGAIGGVSGSNTTGSIKTAASGSTDAHSGVKEYRYLVTNNNTKPSNTNSGFTTSKNFSRGCGKSYYAWAIAVDKAGNVSAVTSLSSTKDGADSYGSWGSCSKSCGGGVQYRTNTCALVTTGLSQSCNVQSCKPATPTLSNPTGGNWVNYNFSLVARTTTASNQIGYWQYSYDNRNWYTYSNSATNTYTTTQFTDERNQAVYIRACTRENACSDSASTMIRIDKTKPTLGYALKNDVTGANYSSNTWSRNGIYRYLYPADNASGVDIVQYNGGGGWNTETNVASCWFGEGVNDTQYRVKDKAGNYSNPIRLIIKADWTPPTYTDVRRVCGGGYGQSWKFYITMEYVDYGSGLASRTVDWYTDRWHHASGNLGGASVGGDNMGTWGNFIKFNHTACDVAGNCSSSNNGGVYGC